LRKKHEDIVKIVYHLATQSIDFGITLLVHAYVIFNRLITTFWIRSRHHAILIFVAAEEKLLVVKVSLAS